MRRVAGSFLMASSALFAAAAVVWIFLEAIQPRRSPVTEDSRTEALAAYLFAGVLVALATAGFLTGRYLHRPSPLRTPVQAAPCERRRLLPLIGYLAGSVGIGTLAALAFILHVAAVGPLVFLIGQPSIFIQLFLGGMLGFKFDSGVVSHTIITAFNILYYVVFFYPLYSLLTMDRKVEQTYCRQMKILLGLFMSIHLVIGLVLAVLLQA